VLDPSPVPTERKAGCNKTRGEKRNRDTAAAGESSSEPKRKRKREGKVTPKGAGQAPQLQFSKKDLDDAAARAVEAALSQRDAAERRKEEEVKAYLEHCSPEVLARVMSGVRPPPRRAPVEFQGFGEADGAADMMPMSPFQRGRHEVVYVYR
jgi:hypothetical protein